MGITSNKKGILKERHGDMTSKGFRIKQLQHDTGPPLVSDANKRGCVVPLAPPLRVGAHR